MAEPPNKPQRLQAHQTRVLLEMQQAQQGTRSRQDLIKKIEELDPAKPRRLLRYIANTAHAGSAVNPGDTVPLGDAPQQVSAWTFIHARDVLVDRVNQATANKQSPAAHLQQLAAIDPVFVTHCEQLMTFAKQVGSKWIFCRVKSKGVNAKQAARQAAKVVKFLSNVEAHITHGRLISATELKKHCEPPLTVEDLPESSPEWQWLWELYVRC